MCYPVNYGAYQVRRHGNLWNTTMQGTALFRYLVAGFLAVFLILGMWSCNRQPPVSNDKGLGRPAASRANEQRRGVTYGYTNLDEIEVDEPCDNHPEFLSDLFMVLDAKSEGMSFEDGVRRTLVISALLDTAGTLHDIRITPGDEADLVAYVTKGLSRMPCSKATRHGQPVSVHIRTTLDWMRYYFKPGEAPAGRDSAFCAETNHPDFDTPPEPVGGLAGIAKSAKYPPMARQASVQGTVQVAVRVSADGTVERAVIASSEYEIFEASALDAVRNAAWKPAMKDGHAVPATVSIPLRYTRPSPYDVTPR